VFRREDTVRSAATNAIMDLIFVESKSKKNGLNSLQDSSSQASCSQQADIANGTREKLFQELSGLLRRCLSQQVCKAASFYIVKFYFPFTFITIPSITSCFLLVRQELERSCTGVS